VGNLTDQFTTMSMDVDQECVRSDRLEEQVGKLESELDIKQTARVHLMEDLCRALDMCTSWVDRAIELHRDVNMLRACIEPIPSSSSSKSNMDISDDCQGGPRRSPEIQSTLVWSSCWGATGSAGRSTQRGEQRRVVRARGNKGEVGVTRDQCHVW